MQCIKVILIFTFMLITSPAIGLLDHDLKKDNFYVLGVGEKGNKRLNILNNVYGSNSKVFLNQIPLSSSMRILSIGCGNGNMEIWMAKNLVPQGKVIAVDASEEQLEIARKNALLANVSNIEFISKNIYELEYNNEFDLVYARFLLVHLEDHQKALRKMISAAKTGGIIASEEMENKALFAYPENPAIHEAIDLIENIGKIRGVDYNLGPKLYSLFIKFGIKKPHLFLSQPVYTTGEDKRLFELSVLEGKDKYINSKLITEKDFNSLVERLNAVSNDDKTVIGFAKLFQIYGIK